MNIKTFLLVMLFANLAVVSTSSLAKEEPLFSPAKQFVQMEGENLYRALCQGCHMPQGQGAVGAGQYPALANNPKLVTPHYAVFMVSKGQGGMPGFSDMLTNAQIAEVVNYVRTHFGNDHKDNISAKDVAPFTNQ